MTAKTNTRHIVVSSPSSAVAELVMLNINTMYRMIHGNNGC